MRLRIDKPGAAVTLVATVALALALGPEAAAQQPPIPGYDRRDHERPPGGRFTGEGPDSPYARRQARNRVVTKLPEAKGIVEFYGEGEPAVAALNALSLGETAKKLAEFHNAGKLPRLHKAREILLCIAANPGHAREVAEWVMANHQSLSDPLAVAAFLDEPLEFVMDLKPLSQGRARLTYRLAEDDTPPFLRPGWWKDWRNPALALTGLALFLENLVLVIVARSRKTAYYPPQQPVMRAFEVPYQPKPPVQPTAPQAAQQQSPTPMPAGPAPNQAPPQPAAAKP